MSEVLDYFESQGRTAVQLAEELFALADLSPEKQKCELVVWATGLNWHEKRVAESVMKLAAQEFGFSFS